MIINKRVVVCYNEPKIKYQNYLGKVPLVVNDNLELSETSFSQQLPHLISLLKKKYSVVDSLSFNKDITNNILRLKELNPDVCFNFVESLDGESNFESYIAGLYELLKIPFTGNSTLCLGTCLNKQTTKYILKANNINTPNFKILEYNSKNEVDTKGLKFPLILKLNKEDASIGISENSVVKNKKEFNNQVEYLFKSYKQNIIVEEYIEGREFNVAILGDKALPISEIMFNNLPKNLPKIVTYEAKWNTESTYYKGTIPQCPANLEETTKNKIIETAIYAFKCMECRDYARVDIRLDKNNTPYVIEVNPNPDILPDSGFARAAKVSGISYQDLLYKIINMALKREKSDTKNRKKR